MLCPRKLRATRQHSPTFRRLLTLVYRWQTVPDAANQGYRSRPSERGTKTGFILSGACVPERSASMVLMEVRFI